jgi:Sister chromatid cohesion protein Dcc1
VPHNISFFFCSQQIAVWLARRLFQSQTQPWEERRFCLRWQSELPGVGNDYQTNLDMLRGVAIPVEGSPTKQKHYQDDDDPQEPQLWKYFPADKLSLKPEERFQALFDIREEWFSEDLEPYILGLVEESGLSMTKLLMNHTTSTTGSKNGTMGKLYRLKQQ